MRDYWLNKLFFDIQQPTISAEFMKDRDAVLARYPMRAELRQAVIDDDIAKIAPHVNAYLLRFYYAILGVTDAEFINRLNDVSDHKQTKRIPHG
jgi:Aromatic-ring-opening dioxygenase LigAB, LigA subunit